MSIDAVTASLIGTAIGAFAGIGGTLITTIIVKRAEERRHNRALAIQVAVTHWQSNIELAKLVFEKSGSFPEMPKFDAILMQKLKLIDIVTNKSLTTETIASKIKDLRAFTDVVIEHTKPKQ